MSIFTVKMKNGVPTRAKCQIVALGNKDATAWTKADCYAPVVSLPVVRLLTALAIHHKQPLKQGEFKTLFKHCFQTMSVLLFILPRVVFVLVLVDIGV
jgi:hypothetical protein